MKLSIFGRGLVRATMAVAVAASALQAQVGKNTALVNPNSAGVAELAALPHVGQAIAQMMVGQRPYLGMIKLDAMLKQHGLTETQLDELYARMFIPLNLNATSAEEILLVPGLGQRMVHEFEEYSPYVALAVWRREMGKYVDDAEVARMEQYVFVPLDLNTASDEDIMTIPGLGPRMLREFKEYRPYANIEQFRREMGKYVDDGEVARLERYVTIR